MHRLASLSLLRSGPRGLTVLRADPQEVETSRTPLDPTECIFECEPGKANVWIARATWGFVALGLLVRLVRFLVVYPIWPDEAFVAANLLNRDYLGLLTPLEFGQVAPILFLWIELTAARLLGLWEWSLRLFPTVCNLASLVLFRHLAARLLRGVPLLLAVGVFATASSSIRHGAEIKPYASDLLAALILLTLAVEWWRSPRDSRYWWALGAIVPVLLALSYPAVLVATGLSFALGKVVLRQNEQSVRRAYLFYNLMLAGSFLFLYFGVTSVQSTAMRSLHRQNSWRDSFPPWDEPWKLPGWLVAVHTGNMLAYPIGGTNGASALTLFFALVGVLAFWRRGRRTPLLLLLSPFAMGLAAASLGQYPYGGSARIMQYLVPSICLLAGLGGALWLVRLQSPAWGRRSVYGCVALLALLGIYYIGSDLVRPYRVYEDYKSRQFARWFWSESNRGADLLCVKKDLGLVFQPILWKTGMSAVYLYHQKLYKRRAEMELADRSSVKLPTRALRLVFFDNVPEGKPLYDKWLTRVSNSHRIGRRWEFVVNPSRPDDLGERDRYAVLELIPVEIDRLGSVTAIAGAVPVPGTAPGSAMPR
jgi:hypothetical protein